MNFGAVSLKMLEALPASMPRNERLNAARKVIRTLVDDCPDEASHRLCTALRAVLKPIVSDAKGTPDEIKAAGNLLLELKGIDPRRIKAEKKTRGDDLLASCDRGAGAVEPTDDDPWLGQPPLPPHEWQRLLDCARLRQGAKPMIEGALDSRPATIENLKRLHFHLESSFPSGGPALGSGPLFAEVTRILIEQGAIKAPDPAAYGERLMAELRARD